MNKDEALDLALEALEMCEVPWTGTLDHNLTKVIAVIKQALAAPVQEPFGYLEIEDIESQREYPHNCRNVNLWHEGGEGMVAIYTTPHAHPAVPDALFRHAPEHPQYIQGWNDCRAEMLKGMKP